MVIKDKQSRQLLTRGSKHEGLYRLENPQFLAFYSSRQQSATDVVWHKRLGHPHQQVLQFLSTTKVISVNKVLKTMCESCQLGKTSKLPFSSSVFKSRRPLERIHCDVWGPAPVTSVQGFRYYVIFIDNFSRFAWFYPIKLKSDVFTIFKSFQSLVETQFEQKIQIFQSDGVVSLSMLSSCNISRSVASSITCLVRMLCSKTDWQRGSIVIYSSLGCLCCLKLACLIICGWKLCLQPTSSAITYQRLYMITTLLRFRS